MVAQDIPRQRFPFKIKIKCSTSSNEPGKILYQAIPARPLERSVGKRKIIKTRKVLESTLLFPPGGPPLGSASADDLVKTSKRPKKSSTAHAQMRLYHYVLGQMIMKRFVFHGSIDRADCSICEVNMGAKSYNLKRHLERKHPRVYQSCLEEIHTDPTYLAQSKLPFPTIPEALPAHADMSSDIVDPSPNATDSPVAAAITSSNPEEATIVSTKKARKKYVKLPKVEKDSMGHGIPRDTKQAFISWVARDHVPTDVVTSASFREFVTLLHPTYRVPNELKVLQHRRRWLEDNAQRHPSEGVIPTTMPAYGMHGSMFKKPSLQLAVPVPQPEREEALIRVLRAGICATDHELCRGYKKGASVINKGGLVLGHEFVGIVVALGVQDKDKPQTWIGKRVVGEINVKCGQCLVCKNQSDDDPAEARNHCRSRQCLGIVNKSGSMAHYLTLPISNLFLVPESMSDAQALFTEPVAAVCRIIEQNIIRPKDRVVVLGDGKLGLLVAEVLSWMMQENSNDDPLRKDTVDVMPIVLVGKHASKLDLAPAAVKIVHLQDVEGGKSSQSPMTNLFDVAIECTGGSSGISCAANWVRPGGTIVNKTTCAGQHKNLPGCLSLVAEKNLVLRGSRCGPFARALEVLGKLDVTKYITAELPLSRVAEAFELSAKSSSIKVQLVMPTVL